MRRGRSARAAGAMLAAPARYVSVSELYSTDEVELLLDEIRELEPTSCRGEDVQVKLRTALHYHLVNQIDQALH